MIETVQTAMKARFPALWLQTHEEDRAMSQLAELCDEEGKMMFVWSLVSGLRERRLPSELAKLEGPEKHVVYKNIAGTKHDLEEIGGVFDFIRERASTGDASEGLFVFAELDELMEDDAGTRRAFREFSTDIRPRLGQHILVVTPRTAAPPVSLERLVTRVTLSVPNREEQTESVQSIINRMRSQDTELVDLDEDGVTRLVNASTGLTADGLNRALRVAITQHGKIDGRAVDLVSVEKRQLVDGTGFLQYEEHTESLSTVGGQDVLKTWLARRMKGFLPAAKEYGLTEPKGVLVVGPPGCGKSLGAKAAAAAWGRPLIRLDVGALFGGLVGESERNTREAISLIEAMSPCVLWIDEIEKGLAGMQSSGSTDGGTTSRVFQSLLTWLNEKKSPVFVFATANDPKSLPAELLRKGRLDEIFAIQLPHFMERQDVLAIHIKKNGRNPEDFDLAAIAEESEGYSGAELEQAILDAMFTAFYEDKEFTTAHIIAEIHETKPMSETMKEKIDSMAQWAADRTRAASSPYVPKVKKPAKKKASTKKADDDIMDIMNADN